MSAKLTESGAKLVAPFTAANITHTKSGLVVTGADGRTIRARSVFNATFADSNALHQSSNIPKLPLDHAVFLHFLIDLPAQYANMGLIVTRGMYAALAPNSTQSHPGSHIFASGQFRIVRSSRTDALSEAVDQEEIRSRYEQAVAEAQGYMPALGSAALAGWTIGTRTNYVDPSSGVAASRAVVLKDYSGISGYHCVFGGKVSCLPEIIKPVKAIAEAVGKQ